jgi:hypothetical protein
MGCFLFPVLLITLCLLPMLLRLLLLLLLLFQTAVPPTHNSAMTKPAQ